MLTEPPELGGPKPGVPADIQLAKLAVAFEQAHAVYFPSSALEMAELGSKILAEYGIRYWISPYGDSITCTQCRKTSRNPNDVAQHYCGACHEFLENRKGVE
jgi:hypothetical protein